MAKYQRHKDILANQVALFRRWSSRCNKNSFAKLIPGNAQQSDSRGNHDSRRIGWSRPARSLPARHPRPCKRGTSWAPYARVVMIYLVVKYHRLLAVPKNLKLLLRKHWKSSKMHHFADTNRMETLIFLMEIPLHFGYYNNWTVID